MLRVLAGALLAAGLWRGWIDWQATIGQGYAYRLTSIGAALEAAFPDRYERATITAAETFGFWDPVGTTLLGLPLALALVGAAGLVWLARRRRRTLF